MAAPSVPGAPPASSARWRAWSLAGNATFFTGALVLSDLFHVPSGDSISSFVAFAVGNLLGPVVPPASAAGVRTGGCRSGTSRARW